MFGWLKQQEFHRILSGKIRLSPRLVTAAVASLAIAVIGMALGSWSPPVLQPVQNSSLAAVTSNTQISPLIFGSNVNVTTVHEPFLVSATTRMLLQNIHIQMLRVQIANDLPDTTIQQTATLVHDLGAIPLVVLDGAVDSPAQALARDQKIVGMMNSVFGNQRVYYEFGNEDDRLDVTASEYTTAWNAVVPVLKKVALNGHFVGPVSYQYNATYLQTFLQHAQPMPDEVSWHEYACSSANQATKNECIANVSNWGADVTSARAVMQNSPAHIVLPIIISAWNLDSEIKQTFPANWLNDTAFLTQFTQTALQQFVDSHIFAAMQYMATSSDTLALVDANNQLTPQAIAMQNTYEQLTKHTLSQSSPHSGSSPAPTTSSSITAPLTPTPVPAIPPTAPPAPVVSPVSSNISFEDGGKDGFYGAGPISSIGNSTRHAKDGTHSLRVSFSSAASAFPYIATARLSGAPQAGQTISVYVYLASGSNVGAKVFALDANNTWFDNGGSAFVPLSQGTWTRVGFTLPSLFNGSASQIGVQFTGTGATVYIDAVTWG